MIRTVSEVVSKLSQSERIGFAINLVGILIGFITAQYSTLAGSIIFSTFLALLFIVAIYSLYTRDFYGGLYEVIEHENIWSLEDPEGREVTHKKKMTVKYIQNNVIAIEDFLWGDGEFMKDYHCSIGHIVDVYKTGSRTNVLVSLRGVRNKGDIETFEFTRKIVDGFTDSSEWVEITPFNRTKKINLKIIFPLQRPCQKATLTTNIKNETREINRGEIASQSDGRQVIDLCFKNPRMRDVFTVRWNW